MSVGDLVRLMTFRQGQANLVELTLDPKSPYVGRPVGEVAMPENAALVTIVRGNRVLVPSADDSLEGGDELLFVAAEDVEDEIRTALGVGPHHQHGPAQ